MPASAVLAPVVALSVTRPAPVRLVRGSRSCPVCAEGRCADASVCAAEFTARSWIDCRDCGGSGFDTTGFDIWCRVCDGARVVEGSTVVALVAGSAA
jgi:hypothetical protein